MQRKSEEWSFRESVSPAVAGLQKNWLPILFIQVVAACVVWAYYGIGTVREGADAMARLKVSGGYPFSFFAGCCAGGLIPEIAKALTGKIGRLDLRWLKTILFNGFVYGVVGLEVDLFYRYQNQWFGSGNSFGTLASKTFVDMAIFSPILSIPTATILFLYRNHNFQWSSFRDEMGSKFYRDRILPGLIPCWIFWIPVLFSVYAMPENLQFWLSILAEAAWSILFIFIVTSSRPEEAHVNEIH